RLEREIKSVGRMAEKGCHSRDEYDRKHCQRKVTRLHHDTAMVTRTPKNNAVNSIFFLDLQRGQFDSTNLRSYLRPCSTKPPHVHDAASQSFQAGRLEDCVGVGQPDRVIRLEAQQNTPQGGCPVG